MIPRVDLITLGRSDLPHAWPLGETDSVEPTPYAIQNRIKQYPASQAEAWLFWDCALGSPRPEIVERAMERPGDVWHAGLCLGTSGLPGIINFIAPTWMLNRDPDASAEATSWRLSLRACLIRTSVLREMGGPRPEFQTLDAAALEMGHRYVSRGVLTRHLPWLLDPNVDSRPPVIPCQDELRFAWLRFGAFWSHWALSRAILKRVFTVPQAAQAWRVVHAGQRPAEPAPFGRESSAPAADFSGSRVTVLVPTIDRYPYLEVLLTQLRSQTIRPFEIIVIDQTPPAQRRPDLYLQFQDLPLVLIFLDESGQCLSRNTGLQRARGEYILFVDDDDEIPPDLIEAHLRNLHASRSDVSSGVAQEVGAGALPQNFTYFRGSDVFPTNNSLIRRDVLYATGLFDAAYNRGDRADADLGMRIYLSGALMVLKPDISVLHHHAPRGGLRTHKARVVTYASSRKNLFQRHLPSATEVYLGLRYFTAQQVHEMLCISAFATFSVRGSIARKTLRLAIASLFWPDTWRRIRRSRQRAEALLKTFPKMPKLGEPAVS